MRNPSIPSPRELWPRSPRPTGKGHESDAIQSAVSGDGRSPLRSGIARLDGLVQAPGLAHGHTGTLPGRRQQSSGAGSADGGDLRQTCSSGSAGGLRFDREVPAGGYAWWYVDALSDDGSQGLTLIGFIGSVFSPYYAWARRRGETPALDHCALNVALYAPRGGRWAMTERDSRHVARDASSLSIGPSAMRWTGDALEFSIDEFCVPLPRRLRGTVRVTPRTLHDRAYHLDAGGRHRWTPFAPTAHVEVAFSTPSVKWSGSGYFDSNAGDEPLEAAFRDWTWSRAGAADDTVVLYDVNTRQASARSLALRFGPHERIEEIEAPPFAHLPRTRWRVARITRADAGSHTRVVKTLEDAPFYSRSMLDTQLEGVRRHAVHESLNLNRFDSAWVRCLLPFRMPRITF